MIKLYESCTLCPRSCGVNRLAGEKGFCGETASLRIAAAVIHHGEEPPITGTGGSGTIFISGCNLGCSFCQNYQVSQNNNGTESLGKTVSPQEFADICAALCDNGAENINIVTGSHAAAGIIEGIAAAKAVLAAKKKENVPFLWNSSGYDSVSSLELLHGYIDVFLPDLKTLDSKIAERYFNADDYPDTAKKAILKMADLAGDKSKIIVRHLILPGHIDSTRQVLHWFADNIKDRSTLSLMTQYTPLLNRKTPERQMPQTFLSEKEFDTVLNWLNEFEIEDGYCQKLVTGSDWLPDFRRVNPFPSELSIPVWSLPAEL